MNKIVSVLGIMFIVLSAQAQTDTTFWFAAPDASSAYSYDRPIFLRISSQQQPCVVTISQPANGGMPTQTINMLPNTTQSIDLTNWINNIECTPGNIIQNRGLKIKSDNRITAYYEVNAGGPNPELFALKGKNAIGTQFYISSQYILGNSPLISPSPISSFNIIASEDNTNVTIIPAKNIIGHNAGIPFTITMNKGQTYAAIASSQLAAQHLQGSEVTANKPIAITLADDLLQGIAYGGSCEDLAGDQTIPLNVLGTEYIAIKGNLNYPYDKVYITAVQNSTTVQQDGVLVTTLNAGQSFELTVSNPSTYIQTSFSAYAYQLTGAGCEVGSAILPKITCTGSSSVTVTRSSTEPLYITLLTKNGGQGNFLLNNMAGIITAAQFSVVPATGGQWYFAKITLPLSSYPINSIIKIDNTANLFQLGFLQGGVLGAGFGYFSDYNALIAEASTNNYNPCIGTTVKLFAETVSSAKYSWTGPNGFTSALQNPIINNVVTSNTGNYILSVNVPGCGNYYDTININVKSNSFSTINQSICEGQTFLGHSNAGKYLDTLVNIVGCDSIRTVNLTIKPRSYRTINQSICNGQSFLGHNISGIYIDTLVAANGCDSIRILNLTVNSSIITVINQSICEGQTYLGYRITGNYIDTFATNYGCDSIRKLNLEIIKAPVLYLGEDSSLCINDTVKLSPGKFLTYLWQDGSSSNYYIVRKPGIYSLAVTNACGSATDEIIFGENSCIEYFSNAFTPNQDGNNEIFKILHPSNLLNYYLAIYNRWGQKVFETKDLAKGWDGNINGKPSSVGYYIWYCEFTKNGRYQKLEGSVLLIR